LDYYGPDVYHVYQHSWSTVSSTASRCAKPSCSRLSHKVVSLGYISNAPLSVSSVHYFYMARPLSSLSCNSYF
jgi:hypothetical protein